MSVERQIDRLERQIRELKVEFERFFAGDLTVPPEPLRGEIQAGLRRLRESRTLRAAADHFRLSQLEARFASFSELFNRRLREREEGSRRRRPVPGLPLHDPASGVVLGESIEPGAAEALYRGLVDGSSRSPAFDFPTFCDYLERQLAAIRAKTGCERVQFRLAAEGGETKLKAKPLPGDSARS